MKLISEGPPSYRGSASFRCIRVLLGEFRHFGHHVQRSSRYPEWLTEPLFNRALVVTVATLILDAVVAFGVPISNDQRAAIIAVVSVIAPIVLAAWARSHVYSPAKVVQLVEAAKTSATLAAEQPLRPTLVPPPATPPPPFPPRSSVG